MFWKFWGNNGTKKGEKKLPRPEHLPQIVGSYMVVEAKKDPDWVWQLKGVSHPAQKKGAFYCRVFDDAEAAKSGVKVKDWNSLNEHLDLIHLECYCDRELHTVRPEKMSKPQEG